MSNTPYLISTGQGTATGNGSTVTISVNNTSVQYDGIIIGVVTNSSSNTVSAISDTKGNQYNGEEIGSSGSGLHMEVWQADQTTAIVGSVDTVTITFAGSGPIACIILGDNGIGITVNPEDIEKVNSGNSGSPNSGSSGGLAQSYEHAISFIANLSGSGNPSWSAPWSSNVLATGIGDSGNNIRISAAYQVVTNGGSITGSGSISSGVWVCSLHTNRVSNLSIATPLLPNGIVQISYSAQITSFGGLGAVTFSQISGSLPPGLSFTSAGALSGTPTTAGTYTFTVQASAATFGPTTTQAYTITVSAPTASSAPNITQYGNNLLSTADAQAGAGNTWVPNSGASNVGVTSHAVLMGTTSGFWTVTAGGASSNVTSIMTQAYTALPNKPYVVSGFVFVLGSNRVAYVGVQWFAQNNQGGVGALIGQSGAPPAVGTSNVDVTPVISRGSYWMPMVQRATSPAGTAFAKPTIWVTTNGGNSVLMNGETMLFDGMFFSQVNMQISCDFLNAAFGHVNQTIIAGTIDSQGLPTGGSDFMDLTQWLRYDQGITYTRGRQDAISEMQAASGNFYLQNDQGTFTRFNTSSLVAQLGPTGTTVNYVNLASRIQIGLADQNGVWYTRFDGVISEVNYSWDRTGNTSVAIFLITDVLAWLNRNTQLKAWTYQTILADLPMLFWPLDDYTNVNTFIDSAGNVVQASDITTNVSVQTQGFTLAAEHSGNNGPPLRVTSNAIIQNPALSGLQWANTGAGSSQSGSAGVETLADAVNTTNSPVTIMNAQGVQITGIFDGSEYWSSFTNQPTTQLRGLDAGRVGPYSTTLPNVYFVPTNVPQSTQNNWIGNQGYQLYATLSGSNVMNLGSGTQVYCVEVFFTVDAVVAGNLSQNTGPYIVLSLGDTRTQFSLNCGIWLGGPTGTTFQIAAYQTPPGFTGQNFGAGSVPGNIGAISIPFTPDNGNCVHHFMMHMYSNPGSAGPYVQAALDGNPFGLSGVRVGTLFLPGATSLDYVSVGGAMGKGGNWAGAISCLAIYNYEISSQQYLRHTQMGQYGMWEQTTDNCIGQLLEISGVPAYWNNVPPTAGLGGSLTEFLDITGQNALANINFYEQVEAGTFFCNRLGQLTFHTRDWKMGYPSVDLFLPPYTFEANNLNYNLVDQYIVNESALASVTFPSGASTVNQPSQNQYGTYAPNPIGSPLQLPILSWNRAMAGLGLPTYAFWPDPNMKDLTAWNAYHSGDSWFMPASIYLDLLTLDPSTGLTISQFLALDIGNVVAPSGKLPVSWPNTSHVTEWFIEGITEQVTMNQHVIQFYTSPANIQRAWRPGDAQYGVLGQTTRIGISAADVNIPVALGKSVSHDGGPPYWPPTFSASMNNNANNNHGYVGANDIRGISDSLSKCLMPPMCVVGCTSNNVSVGSGIQDINSIMPWDTIFVDTEGGMGAVPNYAKWYVVTVPGFYELDLSLATWQPSGTNGRMTMACFVICQKGAQLIAGTTPPGPNGVLNAPIVCPIGETAISVGELEPTAANLMIPAPTTTVYLGVGDMVGVSVQVDNGTNVSAGENLLGSTLSIRWIGYSPSTASSGVTGGSDRVEVTTGLSLYSSVTDNGANKKQLTWTGHNTGCVSYCGSSASTHSQAFGPNRIINNSVNVSIAQGGYYGGLGICYAQLYFNLWGVGGLMTAIYGSTILGAVMQVPNLTTTPNVAGTPGGFIIGSMYGETGLSPWVPVFSGNSQNVRAPIDAPRCLRGQMNIFNLDAQLFYDMMTPLNANLSSGFFIGAINCTDPTGTSGPVYTNTWNGTPGAISLTVYYQ